MPVTSLLTRASPLRLSSTLRTWTACSHPLNTPSLTLTVRSVPPSGANRRWLSVTHALRAQNRNNARASHPPSGICYIANVPYKVTAEELKNAFSEFGQIESVKLLTTDSGSPRGAGFVQFETTEDASHFVEANKADPIFVLDRELYVEHAQNNVLKPVEPSDTLMVSNVQGSSDAEVRALFGSYADEILAVRFNPREAGQLSRRAFVQFRNIDVATEAMDVLKGQKEDIRLTYARQRQTPSNPYTLISRLSQNRS